MRLIDANSILDEFLKRYTEMESDCKLVFSACEIKQDFADMISNTPTVDAVVRHGRWERDECGSYLRSCSVCKKPPVYRDERGNSVAVYAGVCINCGAKMYGGNEDG